VPHKGTKTRLDVLLVERGLAPSRARARALILAGHVKVNGRIMDKAAVPAAVASDIELVAPDHPYVGRGGIKLAHALDVFHVDASGRRALDIGASTGGFTDALLQRGALRVVALDVGHGQLDWRLRQDPRVVVREGVNARLLATTDLPYQADLVSIDVSFISLRLIFPPLRGWVTATADVLALVKPQFEAGRGQVGKGGVVTDSTVHEAVLARVTAEAAASGFTRLAMTPSPIEGASGNMEFFLHLRPEAGGTGSAR
jgi:23S rRNA (cytidine1920-2'-O)/16S rRNA (cytidine1409-2'-O)-methyltransferase